MPGYIALIGFAGIAAFIVSLYIRRRFIESGMTDFYKQHSLYRTTNEPPFVRESLGAGDNLYCCRTNVTTTTGAGIEFGWWEWYLTSNTMINGVPSASFANYLAFSFAPNSVSDDFVRKALQLADKSDNSAARKVKDFFATDTQNPYRAEILADGSLLICWRVTKRRDVLEAKIEWLKNNASPPIQTEIAAPENALTVEPDLKNMEVSFYTHDDYPTIRNKFHSVWANLDVELHHESGKLDKEGWDEFDGDAVFNDRNVPNKIAFALTRETSPHEAMRLFREHFGGRAFVLRDGVSVEEYESLDYCNNPFRLPINQFTYGEFKHRFTERWANLSIKIYNTAPHDGGLWHGSKELADDYEMKNIKNAERAFLHDYAYISMWGKSLEKNQIAAAIRNEKFAVDCEGNLRNARLKEFNEVATAESLRLLSIR